MSNEQKLREAFELGWKLASQWSLSDHLLADMESPAYLTERDGLLQALATTEPEPLSDEQIKALVMSWAHDYGKTTADLIRSVEAHHGICRDGREAKP